MVQILDYHTLKTANGTVGYCQCGEGPVLILVVGYSGTLFHWNKYFVAELAKSFTVYLIDNRKIGHSDSSNENSMLGMAQDVEDFITTMKFVKPLVFGWSMGGIITQTILHKSPGLLGGAVLLATIPHANYTNLEFLELVAKSQTISADEFRMQMYGMFFSENPREELKNFITGSALAISDYRYRFNLEAKNLQDYAVITWPGMTEHKLSQIDVPTLVLWARNDLVVDSRASQLLANFIPEAKLIVYPSGGHFFLHKNPQAVARDVINFFTIV